MSNAHTDLVGNLTRDPELRFTQGGMAVVNVGVAVSHKRNRDAEETSFVDLVLFGSLAENVAESLSKGTRVVASGRLQTRSYDKKDGSKGYATELVCDAVGPDLRWATCTVTRTGGGGGSSPAPAYDADTEPF